MCGSVGSSYFQLVCWWIASEKISTLSLPFGFWCQTSLGSHVAFLGNLVLSVESVSAPSTRQLTAGVCHPLLLCAPWKPRSILLIQSFRWVVGKWPSHFSLTASCAKKVTEFYFGTEIRTLLDTWYWVDCSFYPQNSVGEFPGNWMVGLLCRVK